MAIKGLAYPKTTWAFEERPVASAKLNTWDDRIEAALGLVFFLLNQTWGGGDGVIAGASEHDLETEARPVPGLSVLVQPGYAFISACPFRLTQTTETADVAAPQTQPRIDLVQARLDGWGVTIKTGIEATTPSVPAADADCLALAQLHLRPGMSCIKNSDDGVNGYIVDGREFL
jgi:hypothetical protein